MVSKQEIFIFDRQHFCLSHLFGVNHKLTTTEFGTKKQGTSLYRMIRKAFWYLEPFSYGSSVWETDRRTQWHF